MCLNVFRITAVEKRRRIGACNLLKTFRKTSSVQFGRVSERKKKWIRYNAKSVLELGMSRAVFIYFFYNRVENSSRDDGEFLPAILRWVNNDK